MTATIDKGLQRAFTGYYAATAGFLLLDLAFGLNVRVAFLEGFEGWRLAYYGICCACFVMVVIRPGWTVAVTAVESLVTIVALIFSVALPAMLHTGPLPGLEALVNFIVSGSVAYLAWTRSMTALFGPR